MLRLRWIILSAGAVAVTLAAVAYTYAPGRLHSRPRVAWKDTAIKEITKRIPDDTWLQSQISEVRAIDRHPRADGGWFTDELLLMQNGEWIVARSICRKRNRLIHDLFIGRASDGNWYYSTFHFCVGMDVLHGEPQPATLEAFVRGYWLRPFTPPSDECLNETWVSGPYGRYLLDPTP